MRHYLAIFTGSAAASAVWEQLSDAERQERHTLGMAAWKQWASDNAGRIVEAGGPLGKTKLVNKAGISDIRNAMAAYTVVRADNQEDAAQLFLEHPHFTIFPGEAVEVMEVLPVPAG